MRGSRSGRETSGAGFGARLRQFVGKMKGNQRRQQVPACCTGGHGTLPNEQYTQQSPGFGRRTVRQFSHS
ncbi:protein of unknown function [Burkholderia multivorans]